MYLLLSIFCDISVLVYNMLFATREINCNYVQAYHFVSLICVILFYPNDQLAYIFEETLVVKYRIEMHR